MERITITISQMRINEFDGAVTYENVEASYTDSDDECDEQPEDTLLIFDTDDEEYETLDQYILRCSKTQYSAAAAA